MCAPADAADMDLWIVNLEFALAVRPVRKEISKWEPYLGTSVFALKRFLAGMVNRRGGLCVPAHGLKPRPPLKKAMMKLKQRFLNVLAVPPHGSFGMMIADHFDHRSDAGFVRAYDAHAARRQFQISIVLVAVLVLAAVALGMLARVDRPTAMGRSSAVTASSPHVAETLLDIRG